MSNYLYLSAKTLSEKLGVAKTRSQERVFVLVVYPPQPTPEIFRKLFLVRTSYSFRTIANLI